MKTITQSDFFHRSMPPQPWAEGEKIPWDEPVFSERMLREHLSQEHDLASRRSERIDAHVDWIHRHILGSRPSAILELACGPGLYLQRLAERGHTCTGVDFSPASIDYAILQANRAGLAIEYQCEDIRRFRPPAQRFDGVLFIFGEMNVFRPIELAAILQSSAAALRKDGKLVIEYQTYDAARTEGQRDPGWQHVERGLFAESPHVVLRENFWHPSSAAAAVTRYFVMDLAAGTIRTCSQTTQAYRPEEIDQMLADAGCAAIEHLPSLTGDDEGVQPGMAVVVAEKLPAPDSP